MQYPFEGCQFYMFSNPKLKQNKFMTAALGVQVNKMHARIRMLKQRLEEAEEEASRIKMQKRRLQSDLEEQMEVNETTAREVGLLRGKLKGTPVSRTMKLSSLMSSRSSVGSDLDDSTEDAEAPPPPQQPPPTQEKPKP